MNTVQVNGNIIGDTVDDEYNIVVVNTDGTGVGTVTQTGTYTGDFLVYDVVITNSLNTQLFSIPAETNQILPDVPITVTDSMGVVTVYNNPIYTPITINTN